MQTANRLPAHTFATNCHRFYSVAITKISLLPQYRITDKLNCEACFHFCKHCFKNSNMRRNIDILGKRKLLVA